MGKWSGIKVSFVVKEVRLFSETISHSSSSFLGVLCWEVVPFLEGPLSEVPTYKSSILTYVHGNKNSLLEPLM